MKDYQTRLEENIKYANQIDSDFVNELAMRYSAERLQTANNGDCNSLMGFIGWLNELKIRE